MPSGNRNVKAEDLYDLPDDALNHELVAGCLISEPLPGTRHGAVLARVVYVLGEYLERNPAGRIVGGDCGFILARSPDTVRGPDVAFVTRERYEAIADVRKFFPGAPDLAVEVRSPSDVKGEVRSKVADYLLAGTRLVWVLDPETVTVFVYGPGLPSLLAPRMLGPDDTIDGGDVLPGFSTPVKRLFELP